jgi:hypothetical protein
MERRARERERRRRKKASMDLDGQIYCPTATAGFSGDNALVSVEHLPHEPRRPVGLCVTVYGGRTRSLLLSPEEARRLAALLLVGAARSEVET